jgi:amino acid transporter
MANIANIPTLDDVNKSDGIAGEKLDNVVSMTQGELELIETLGYQPELRRNRSMFTLLFQALAIAAVPFAVGGPLISSIYGGGQLSLFIGWISCCVLSQCVALSIAELASRYPTSAGPYYWSFQVSSKSKIAISYINGWIWLAANWTISLGVNFGFASILAATITMYKPEWEATNWQLTLIFWALLVVTFLVCAFADKWMPLIDTVVAVWTVMTIIVVLIALSVKAKAGRHNVTYALTHYDKSLSGWGDFTFFIGLLPSAYTFAALGMISVMAEQVDNPQVKVPKAISLAIPIEALSGLLFVLPICFTLPPLEDIASAPYAQALPVVFELVMGSKAGALGLMVLILVLTLTCSFSITIAASRTTWAFARDQAMPFSKIFAKVDKKLGVPINALILVSVVQALLGLINFGSSFAFTAFISVGVMGLEASYLFPILISLLHRRKEVNQARFTMGPLLGFVVNSIALAWIIFQIVLFSMPTVLPVIETSMNYASVVFVGFAVFSVLWYYVYARKGKHLQPRSFRRAYHADNICSVRWSS